MPPKPHQEDSTNKQKEQGYSCDKADTIKNAALATMTKTDKSMNEETGQENSVKKKKQTSNGGMMVRGILQKPQQQQQARSSASNTNKTSATASNDKDNKQRKVQENDSVGAVASTKTNTQEPQQDQQELRQQQPLHNKKKVSLVSYIPAYLRPYIHPYHGDFCYSPHVRFPQLLVQLMAEGFLPMCSQDQVLLPKLHEKRSCILLHPSVPNIHEPAKTGALHISKSVRKKAKPYSLTWNQEWMAVVEGCRRQHGTHCWLYPPLVESFEKIYRNSGHEQAPCQATILINDNNDETYKDDPNTKVAATAKVPVRLHSIELWRQRQIKSSNSSGKKGQDRSPAEDESSPTSQSNGGSQTKQNQKTTLNKAKAKKDKNNNNDDDDGSEWILVAGEIGYGVGGIYTSLTGYTEESSAGSVQLAALGCALRQAGFTIWDLGMDMDYKRKLGATLLPRDEFVQLQHQHRTSSQVTLHNLYNNNTTTTTQPKKNDNYTTDAGTGQQQCHSGINARDLIDSCR